MNYNNCSYTTFQFNPSSEKDKNRTGDSWLFLYYNVASWLDPPWGLFWSIDCHQVSFTYYNNQVYMCSKRTVITKFICVPNVL